MTAETSAVVVAAIALAGTIFNAVFAAMKARRARVTSAQAASESEDCARQLTRARGEIRELNTKVTRLESEYDTLRVENSRLYERVGRLTDQLNGDGR